MYLQHYIMAIIYLVFTAFHDGFYLSIINIMSVLQLISLRLLQVSQSPQTGSTFCRHYN